MQMNFGAVLNAVVCAVVLCCAGVAQAADANAPQQVAPEVFQAPNTSKPQLRLMPSSTAARSAQVTSSNSNAYALPALTTTEQQSLEQSSSAASKAYRIGIGRALPSALSDGIDFSQWQWTSVTGGQVAHFTLSSSDAARVRVLVKVGAWPDGVELRFYAPSDTSTVFAPTITANSTFWSPSLAGDSISLELFLPDGVAFSDVGLQLLQVSHLAVDPADSSLKSTVKTTTTNDYTACQVDIACASSAWQETAKAVARYVFTDTDGYSYLCTGTLLADSDSSTQIPYFLTAAHCISNSTTASSMDFFWLYANSSCGGSDATLVQTSGGAQLLAAQTSLDTTFLQVNLDPPSGVTLSGWSVTPLTVGDTVTGIHHGMGYPKKYASGQFTTRVKVSGTAGSYSVTGDDTGSFSQVVWSTGITAPGSSGSGLWVEKNGVHFLNGTLLGGASACSATSSPDQYTRLEASYPLISNWLAGSTPSFRLVDASVPPNPLVDGVLVKRYLQGLRGTALTTGVTSQTLDSTALNSQLAAIVKVLDIDQDGTVDVNIDSELLIRYLMGLRGDALISGLDLSQSGRADANAITEYLSNLIDNAT